MPRKKQRHPISYHSPGGGIPSRRMAPDSRGGQSKKTEYNKRMRSKLDAIVIILVIVAIGLFVYKHHHDNLTAVDVKPESNVATITNYCADNTLSQEVIVSISKRQMWACQGVKTVHSNLVVTGMEMYAADLTPPGTYKIYDKLTNQDLTGTDSTGSWNDHVNYWLPFLQNQYGTYGFHDATWRAASDFGNISPDSINASHGCVEMPLAAAGWLYNWAQVGTTVIIES